MEEAKTRRGWLASSLLYALGNVLVAAAIGAAIAGVGGSLIAALTERTTRIAIPAVVYTLVGLFGLAYALVELGFWRLPVPGLHAQVPAFVQRVAYYPRAFLLGAVVGGGFTVGCPFPTYHVILAWIAATGGAALGALVLGVYGLGRALPVFAVGIVLFMGIKPWRITRWINDHHDVIDLVNGLGLAALGAFLITYWGVLLTVRTLVR